MVSARDLPGPAFVALACALPLALFAVHRELGHSGDIGFFHDWYVAFDGSRTFYRDGPGINYPIVGVLLVCGPPWIVERVAGAPLDIGTFTALLKCTIVAGEIAFMGAIAWLARVLGSRRPRALALAVYALPSSWAGSAWFGQTDVWGSALLLVSAAALVLHRRDGSSRWLVLGLGALHLALLAKQLTWFAAPGLVWLALAGLRAHPSRGRALLAVLSPLLLGVPDLFLTLPDGHRSHLLFLLTGTGSAHGELAVASGASVWSTFVVGGTPAAEVRPLGISSHTWGLSLFALAMIAAAWRAAREGAPSRALVAFTGIGSLAMATLLTGVHERYLVHAVPFLLLADPLRLRCALGAVTGTLAGVFVLSTIHSSVFVGPLSILARPEPLAVLELAWLLAWLLPWGRRSTNA